MALKQIKQTVTTLAIALSVIVACQKEEAITQDSDDVDEEPQTVTVADTLFPSCWLPAYPGSYWVFDNGDTVHATGYYQENLLHPAPAYPSDPDTTWYVPRYDGESVFYDEMRGFTGTGYHYVFDQVGASSQFGNQYTVVKVQCLAMDSILTINGVTYDSVQVVAGTVGNSVPSNVTDAGWYSYKCYVKNIGIVRTGQYHQDSTTHYDIKDLVEHQINWP